MKTRNVAIIIFYDESKRILLQNRKGIKNSVVDWGFFGGGIEEGETPEQAVVRETKEELDFKLNDFKSIGIYGDALVQLNVFISLLKDNLSRFHQIEGKSMQLFSIEDAIKLNISERDKRVIEDLRNILEVKEEKVEIESKGDKIIGFLTSPNKKVDSLILLVHGFTGNMNGPSDLYKRLAYQLSGNGFAVYRFNFRFTSDSFEDYHKMTIAGEVDDLKFLIKEFSKKYDKIGMVGESLGGAISILGYTPEVKCLVLFYPAIFFNENIANRWSSDEDIKEMNKKGVLPWVRSSGQKLFVGKKFIEEVNKTEIFPKIKKIKCPIMFVHGDVDSTVSFTESERAFKVANEPKKIEIIKGAHHGFKDKDYKPSEELQNKAIKFTIDWFNKWLKSNSNELKPITDELELIKGEMKKITGGRMSIDATGEITCPKCEYKYFPRIIKDNTNPRKRRKDYSCPKCEN